MGQRKHYGCVVATCLAALVLSGLLAQPAAAKAVTLDASYLLAANGDLDVTMKLTTSMILYEKLRHNIANLYLLLRHLASQRAEMEVEQQKADWDDASRTITISYRALGMARNLGNHWEFEIPPQADFSNLDIDKRTVYFSEEIDSPLGKIAGRAKLILPPEAQQYRWDSQKRAVSYVIPRPKKTTPQKKLIAAAGILGVLGLALIAASFLWQEPVQRERPAVDEQKLLE